MSAHASLDDRVTAIERQLARLIDVITAAGLPPEVQRALLRAPAPRRQRKPRVLAPRKRYSLKRDAQEYRVAIRALTPATQLIAEHLFVHPGRTVPQLAAELDLKRKTVQNALSNLQQCGVLVTEDV